MSLASSSRALAWSTLGEVGDEAVGVLFRCVLRARKVGGDSQGGFYSLGIKEKDSGQG